MTRDKDDVAMQVRCVHCGREQWAMAVHDVSTGDGVCVWCGEASEPMSEAEYRKIMRERRAELERP